MTDEEKNEGIRREMQHQLYERGVRDMYHLAGKAVCDI